MLRASSERLRQAGVKPSQVARQLGLSQSEVRKALASERIRTND